MCRGPGFHPERSRSDSAAGSLELRLTNEKKRQPGTANQVLAIGDSRLLFRTALANKIDPAIAFASIATPGTTPRCWYYMLRDVDPRADRYSAILISVANYDNSEWEIGEAWTADIGYLAPLLTISDAAEFSSSFDNVSNKWLALRSVLFKGLAYQRDVQDLLARPQEREAGLKWARDGSAEALAQYAPPGRNVTGLTMDWTAMRIVHYPDSMDEPARKEARRFLLRNPPPPHLHQRYLQKWYGKIVDHYRGSQTRLIFTRLPRGPLPRQYPTEQPGLLREYAAHGRVTLLDEHLFDSLERPELFQDAMHLNAQGSEQFTRTLVQELDALAHPNR